jgi:predicted transcriptional regulator
VRIDQGEADRLEALAKRNDRSLSAELRRAIRAYLTLSQDAA